MSIEACQREVSNVSMSSAHSGSTHSLGADTLGADKHFPGRTPHIDAEDADSSCPIPPSMHNLAGFTDFDLIGEGRVTKVYAAKHRNDDKLVAIKAYCRACLGDAELGKVWNQLNVVQAIDHPHIINIHSALIEKDTLFIVEEYAERGDLWSRLTMAPENKLVEADLMVKVVVPLLKALQHLAHFGIVHRDVKPENLLFVRDKQSTPATPMASTSGRLVLSDFRFSINKNVKLPMARLGTLEYMAPEVLAVFLGAADVDKELLAPGPKSPGGHTHRLVDEGVREMAYDEKVDVWAVGCVVYEALFGITPFVSPTDKETASKIMWGTPDYPPGGSEEAVAFLERVFVKRPEDRPSASELLNDPLVAKYCSH